MTQNFIQKVLRATPHVPYRKMIHMALLTSSNKNKRLSFDHHNISKGRILVSGCIF